MLSKVYICNTCIKITKIFPHCEQVLTCYIVLPLEQAYINHTQLTANYQYPESVLKHFALILTNDIFFFLFYINTSCPSAYLLLCDFF